MAIVSDHDQHENHPHAPISPGASAPVVDSAAVGAFLRAVTETAAAAGARAVAQQPYPAPIVVQVTAPATVQSRPVPDTPAGFPTPHGPVPGHPGIDVAVPCPAGAALRPVRVLRSVREKWFLVAFGAMVSGCAAVAIALGTHTLRSPAVFLPLGAWVLVGAVTTVAAGAALAPEHPSALGRLQ